MGVAGQLKVEILAGLVCRHDGGFAPERDVVVLSLVGEDVESHLGPLLLYVLDEDCDLHRTANLNISTFMGFRPSNISEKKDLQIYMIIGNQDEDDFFPCHQTNLKTE